MKLGVMMIPGNIARKLVDRVEASAGPLELQAQVRAAGRADGSLRRTSASRDGFTHVVFGHFHHKMVVPAGGATVTVLPAWYESGEAMMICARHRRTSSSWKI